MLLWEAAHVYSACNLCLQKLLHLQLFGMSTTSLNPNGARDNSMMFMIFLNFHCCQVSGTQNLCNYLHNCSKKKKKEPYLLFILFSSFLSWSKASLCYCRPTALCISKEQGLCFIIFFISLPNTTMPERLWQKYTIF